jgi:glycosyltransferase involved in cell wall biosynthesis
MHEQPLVSVVIPTFNAAAFVEQAVQSALTQSYKSLEVIVVDDGSTDTTSDALQPFRERITYIHQSNQGPSAARNRGIRTARGELIAFLDADDVWMPEKLAEQVCAITATPRLGLVHSDVLEGDYQSQQYRARGDGREFVGDCYARLFVGNRIITSSVLLRRTVVEELGMFDERISKPSAEDYDLWLRIARSYEFGFSARPLVYYRLHANNASNNLKVMASSELFVIHKALEADPQLPTRVGPGRIRDRLFGLLFDVGYCAYRDQHYREAHYYFGQALRQAPTRIYPLALWAATMFPSRTINVVRRAKRLVWRGD